MPFSWRLTLAGTSQAPAFEWRVSDDHLGNRDPRWGEARDMDPQALCTWLCSPKGHPAGGDQRLGPGSKPSGFYGKVWGGVAVEG